MSQRTLTQAQRRDHLQQNQCAAEQCQPRQVIRLNSTYLELCDGAFGQRGTLSTFLLLVLALLVFVLIGLAHDLTNSTSFINKSFNHSLELTLFAGAGVLLSLCLLTLLMLARHTGEFGATHYPVRFNRQNRTVYFYRPNGSVLQASWDALYFTLWREARAPHKVSLNAILLKDPHSTSGPSIDLGFEHPEAIVVQQHWEFIRRYMEEGAHAVAHTLQECLPIDQRRETLREGWRTLVTENTRGSINWGTVILCGLLSTGRALSMHLSKIPQWPDQIEAQCPIDRNDTYVFDASGNLTLTSQANQS